MTPSNIVMRVGTEYRPCWVDGRRAMFHRWTDSARPVTPRGMDEETTTRRYQLHNVHGVVEYEDGTVARVWPSNIQFADGGAFDEWDWEAMEHHRDEQAAQIKEENKADDQEQPAAEVNKECETCAHVTENVEFCSAADNDCQKCMVRGCICKRCKDYDHWEVKSCEE